MQRRLTQITLPEIAQKYSISMIHNSFFQLEKKIEGKLEHSEEGKHAYLNYRQLFLFLISIDY